MTSRATVTWTGSPPCGPTSTATGGRSWTGPCLTQLEQVAHSTLLGLAHPPAIVLARRLAEIAPPGLNKVFFSDNGSTAVEVALKMAFQYWQNRGQRRKAAFSQAQQRLPRRHPGGGVGGGHPLVPRDLPSPVVRHPGGPGPLLLPLPPTGRLPGAMPRRLEELVAAHHQELAAVILEPVMQGAAGMIAQPPGYLAKVREVTRRHDVLLIADEVAVGFGRTGRMFACEHEEVSPDLMCLAKGITGGYLPLAATLATDEVYQAFLGEFEEFKTFFHGHTYTGNPLARGRGPGQPGYLRARPGDRGAGAQDRAAEPSAWRRWRSIPTWAISASGA